jgi:Fur family peroxide stress response transcriptional regulator
MAKSEPKTIRQSKQRNHLLQLLRSTDRHPTADWLYEQLKKNFPNLSLGTVYRNLSLLIEQGEVKKIHCGSTFDRFEANTQPHYHLICESCGTMTDLEMPGMYNDLNKQAKQLTTFTISHHKIEFYGICQKCARKDAKAQNAHAETQRHKE